MDSQSSHRIPPLDPRESAVLALAAAHLCFLPWALGSMHAWSQEIGCALGCAALLAALLPRGGPDPFRALRRLARFPMFWLGTGFLAWIAAQALNPSWTYRMGHDGSWWMRRIPSVTWLPHGMITPFAVAGGWRSLLIDGSALSTACAIWVGFTRRRTVRLLFALLTVNACLLACLAYGQRLAGLDRIYGTYLPPQAYFVGSFIYKNHAGAYFNILTGLAAGMSAWSFADARRRGTGNRTALAYAAATCLIGSIVIASYSRAATVIFALAFAALPLLLARTPLLQGRRFTPGVFVAGTYAALAIATLFGLAMLDGTRVMDRLDSLAAELHGTNTRLLLYRASWDMARADPVLGWGSDGFRFCFPLYQWHYPTLFNEEQQNHTRLYFEHAHNDYLEFLIEFGLAGVAWFAATAWWWIRAFRTASAWTHPCCALLAAGLATALLHALVDFPFHNPALLVTWCSMLPAALVLARTDAGGAA